MDNSNTSAYLQPGDVVAEKYQIIQHLGSGAMGEVYLCRHQELKNKHFVLKALKPSIANNDKVIQRFHNEIKAALDVTHPHVVRAYEFISDNDLVAYTMEYIKGGDLAKKMEMIPQMPFDQIRHYLIQILDGTAALHERGIIHRDIKPENILLTVDDDVKISDFGISIFDNQARITEAGTLLGTTSYIAPEYVQNQEVNCRTDIYAIGVIGYELIAGTDPFPGSNIYVKLQQRLEVDPYDPTMYRQDCPKLLAKCILKAIARNPKERYQNCNQMIDHLLQMPLTESDSAHDIDMNNDPRIPKTLNDVDSFRIEKTREFKVNKLPGVKTTFNNEVHDISTKGRVRQFSSKFASVALPKATSRSKELLMISVFSLIMLGLIGFISYDKFFKKDPKKEKELQKQIINQLIVPGNKNTAPKLLNVQITFK